MFDTIFQVWIHSVCKDLTLGVPCTEQLVGRMSTDEHVTLGLCTLSPSLDRAAPESRGCRLQQVNCAPNRCEGSEAFIRQLCQGWATQKEDYIQIKKKKTLSVIYFLFIKCFLHNSLEQLMLLLSVLGCKTTTTENSQLQKKKKQQNIQIQGAHITNQQIDFFYAIVLVNIKDRSIQCAKAVMPEQWLSATWLPALKNNRCGSHVSDYWAERKTMQLYFKTKSKNPVQEVSDAEDVTWCHKV